MKIHREGHQFLVFIAMVLGGLNLINFFSGKRSRFYAGLAASGAVFGFIASFFRQPSRRTPSCDRCVISPADGHVVTIEEVYEDEYLRDKRLMVSIFLSIFDVHMNWIPADGKVVYYRYHPGTYLVALHPKSSELNERCTVVIETPQGEKILVRQIAGLLARRISTYVAPFQTVSKGEELGFIKFGSRVDIFLPLNSDVKVTLYQKVAGGETILAALQESRLPLE